MKKDTTLEHQTHYIVSGEGEPLILIHGVGLDHTMWQKQVDYFSDYYKVYAYDMLGHGKSGKLVQDMYTLKGFTNQLHDFMEMMGIERAHLVGFSMGGMIVQSFGLANPERIKTLTISNAVSNRTKEERESVLARVKMVEKEGKKSTIDIAIKRWFNQEFIKDNLEIVENIKKRLEQNDDQSYLNTYRVFATADQALSDKLVQIKTPTLVITGENDVGSNPRMAKQMHESISLSEICIVPDARHMLPVENSVIYNQHVHEFLKKHRSRKR